ncbi:oligopeptide:H+ symporter [Campylobacter canadensis]|uniref:MFS transporter n=1 Tax=Campylobacter canadensis TaxID=449520 RepID=A0ABS7WTB9_9BACT|nr:oligopeptide:H+ symporter [Campylobacter canadensis]MBZ7987289.1 MFS transporter [Campylobacter canadensis]MBZ7998282.1 MFS transporter [Campylobacter canadensis]
MQPKSDKSVLFNICYIEAFERFAYLGFSIVFTLYLIDVFHINKGIAGTYSAAFGASIYLFGMIGAYLGNFFLGSKRCVFYGLLFLYSGYLFLLLEEVSYTIIALMFLLLGSSLIKTNITALLAKYYSINTQYAFSLFYVFVNIGCFLGVLLIGYISQVLSYLFAFILAAISMLICILIYFKADKNLDNEELSFAFIKDYKTYILLAFIAFACTFDIFIISQIISVLAICTPIFIYIGIYKKSENKANYKKFAILCLCAIFFFMLIFQCFNTLSILSRDKIDANYFNIQIPSTTYISAMFFTGIIFGGFFSNLVKNYNINNYILISLSMMVAAFVFIFIAFLSKQNSINPIIFLIIYMLLGMANVVFGAIGLDLSTKLSDEKYKTSSLGLWFLCSAAAQGIEGIIVKYYDKFSSEVYFGTQGFFVFLCAVIILVFSKKLSKGYKC